jgi:hypothetical protein
MTRRQESGRRMSAVAAHLRDPAGMAALAAAQQAELDAFWQEAAVAPADLPALLKNRDLLLTRLAVLDAMRTAADTVGTRGAALVLEKGGEPLLHWHYRQNRPLSSNQRLITAYDGTFRSTYQPCRPLPTPNGWFETVWEAYRNRMANIKETE